MCKKPCMRFTLTDTKPTIFESKVGGVGYIPHDGDVPVGEGGTKMTFLAQVNCADLDLEDFPKSGILQFWVLEDDGLGLGWKSPTEQTTYRVVYYSCVDTTVTEEEVQAKHAPIDDEDYFPVKGQFGMAFEKGEDEGYSTGHKVGGYPYFTQNNVIEDGYPEYSVLLFQLDSDHERIKKDDGYEYIDKVMWGDSGVGNFFIKPEKLKALDFSDIVYNWDCC